MTNKEWVEKAMEALEWKKAYALKNPDCPDQDRRWGAWANDAEDCPRLLAEAPSQALAWKAAKELLEMSMRQQIGRALRLKDFLDRVAAGW